MAEAVSRQFIARAPRIYRWADNARVSKDETPFMYYLFGLSEIEDFLGTGDISPFSSLFRWFFRVRFCVKVRGFVFGTGICCFVSLVLLKMRRKDFD